MWIVLVGLFTEKTPKVKGRQGVCEYREICGGCRTRAQYYTGDLFESDPACNYIPKVLREQ